MNRLYYTIGRPIGALYEINNVRKNLEFSKLKDNKVVNRKDKFLFSGI